VCLHDSASSHAKNRSTEPFPSQNRTENAYQLRKSGFAALRPAELGARDVDGGRLSARQGVVVVRSGAGDAFREVASMPELGAR
jgi:hypothetical protein